MKTIKAIKDFPYDGKPRRKGEVLDVPNDHAKLLVNTRNAKLTEKVPVREVVKNNRAMTATPATPPTEGRAVARRGRGEGTPRRNSTGGGRRGYTRSDTVAES